MEPCPNCGFPLGKRDLEAGRCPHCDSVVTPILKTNPAPSHDDLGARGIWRELSDPPLSPQITSDLLVPSPGSAYQRMYEEAPFASLVAPDPLDVPPPPRRSRSLMVLTVLIGFIIILVAVTLVLAASNRPSATASPPSMATAAAATQTAGPAATITLNRFATQTAGPMRTATTSARSPAATGTPGTSTPAPVTSTPAPTATPAPGDPPVLYVTPSKISFLLCLNKTANFTIANTGMGILEWSIARSDYANITPQTSGTLSYQQSITLTVQNINGAGSIIVTATDADGATAADSPQSVMISCTA